MWKTKGVPAISYQLDDKKRRYNLSPFLHYPDLCPWETRKDREGDCAFECGGLEEDQRACCREAKGLPPLKEGEEETEIKWAKPKEEKETEKKKVEEEKAKPDTEEKGEEPGPAQEPQPEPEKPPGETDGPVALPVSSPDAAGIMGALVDQTKGTKKKINQELDNLIRAMEIARDRFSKNDGV